jgi:hypothetical protein
MFIKETNKKYLKIFKNKNLYWYICSIDNEKKVKIIEKKHEKTLFHINMFIYSSSKRNTQKKKQKQNGKREDENERIFNYRYTLQRVQGSL